MIPRLYKISANAAMPISIPPSLSHQSHRSSPLCSHFDTLSCCFDFLYTIRAIVKSIDSCGTIFAQLSIASDNVTVESNILGMACNLHHRHVTQQCCFSSFAEITPLICWDNFGDFINHHFSSLYGSGNGIQAITKWSTTPAPCHQCPLPNL